MKALSKVYFIGAGPGEPELITVKGKRLLEEADIIIYTGSLINPEILKYAKKNAAVFDSASMSLDEILKIMVDGVKDGKIVARLHTGDTSLYSAIAEQMAELKKAGIGFEIIPGVSSASAAAASLNIEYTLPEITQTVIYTRIAGRTDVPAAEKLSSLAAHNSTMVIFLSVQKIKEVVDELLKGYSPDTPVAVVYKASWKEERIIRGVLEDIADKVRDEKINKTALIIIGKVLDEEILKIGKRSKLYDKRFEHGYRKSGVD
ncbi:MAG: precorrin-4 C(11)-methyltransferase [Nitrospirota bacterium]